MPPDPLGCFSQLLDLCRGEELTTPALCIRALPGRFDQTFPKTSIGRLEGDFDNAPVFDRPRTELSRKGAFSGMPVMGAPFARRTALGLVFIITLAFAVRTLK
jgi:hypothetical protein